MIDLGIYTAILVTVTTTVTVSRFLYDVWRNRIVLRVEVCRDQMSAWALQNPNKCYLLLKVANNASEQVLISEFGFVYKGKPVSLVDMPYAHILVDKSKSPFGSHECNPIPGMIPPRSEGQALFLYTAFAEHYKCVVQNNLLEKGKDSNNFTGHYRTVQAFEALQELVDETSQTMRIYAYVKTASGRMYRSRKVKVSLSKLSDVTSTTFNYSGKIVDVFSDDGVRVKSGA